MKTCTFLKGMVAGMAVGVLLDNALRPSFLTNFDENVACMSARATSCGPTPKFRKTQAGKTLHRLTCALDDAVDEVCSKLQ